MGVGCNNLVRGIAIFLGFVTLVFACVGFSTNYWLEFDVDRELLTREQRSQSMINVDLGRFTYTRHRGIFRECYSDDDVPFLDRADDVVDSDCFELDFEEPDHVEVSDDYCTRIELLRCVIAFFAVGIAFGIATIVVAVVSIFRRRLKWVVISMLLALFTGLFIATAISFFLGVDHMEREDRGNNRELIFRKNWQPEMDDATSRSFGWSFVLSWVAVGLALICAVIYLFIALSMRNSQDDDSSSESDASDERDDEQKPAEAYMYHNPYEINKAYQGNLNPVYWPFDNKSRPSRRALQLVAPSSQPGSSGYGHQPPGPFLYGHSGVLMPAVSYVHSPNQSRSNSRKE